MQKCASSACMGLGNFSWDWRWCCLFGLALWRGVRPVWPVRATLREHLIIGNNNPVNLMDYIDALEGAFGKEAIKEFLFCSRRRARHPRQRRGLGDQLQLQARYVKG